jgi:hypothetical protein
MLSRGEGNQSMSKPDRNDPDEIRERSRSRKDGPNEGIGSEEEGVRTSVPSYTEGDDHTTFLGVEEPVVPPEDRGDSPPESRGPEGYE